MRKNDVKEAVAIGECGLDYDRMFSPQAVQLEWCRRQVELAVQLQMPLFLHERDRGAEKGKRLGSAKELLSILRESQVEPKKVCIHCFTGEAQELKEYVSAGYFIGLTGFAGMKRRGSHIRELLQSGALPLEQLMIELLGQVCTAVSCQDRLPLHAAGQGLSSRVFGHSWPPLGDKSSYEVSSSGKNEPCTMPAVCCAVAECLQASSCRLWGTLRQVPADEVARVTTANALKFFSM